MRAPLLTAAVPLTGALYTAGEPRRVFDRLCWLSRWRPAGRRAVSWPLARTSECVSWPFWLVKVFCVPQVETRLGRGCRPLLADEALPKVRSHPLLRGLLPVLPLTSLSLLFVFLP
jgi:hypothetical protein